MPRTALYRAQGATTNGRVLIRVEMTPAYNTALVGSYDILTIPWQAFGGGDAKMPGSAGWDDLVTGTPKSETLKLTFTPSELGIDANAQDFRDYLLNPAFTDGGSVTIGGDVLTFDTLNTWTVLTDDGTAGASWRIVFQGCQRRQAAQTFGFSLGRPGPLVVELVHISHIILSTLTPTHLGAWMMVDDGTPGSKGPHQWCYSMIWTDTGAPTYAYAHGAVDSGGVHPEMTWYKLNRMAYGITEIGALVYREFIRRATAAVGVYSATETGGTLGNWFDHWTLYEPEYDSEQLHSATTIATTARYILGKIAFDDDPDVLIGGLFHPDGLQAKWKTLATMLGDSLESAVAKGRYIVTDEGDSYTLRFDIAALSAAIDAAVSISPAVGADFYAEPEPQVSVGAHLISTATGSVTGGTGDDQTDIVAPAPWDVQHSIDGAGDWPLPPGLHNLPQLWPDGDRSYTAAGFDVIAQTTNQLVVYTAFVPIWCIWHATTAGGLLSAERMVKVHHYASVTDGVQTYPNGNLILSLPMPDRADFIAETGGTADPDNKPYGDTVLGSPLRLQMLVIQTDNGIPYLAAGVMANRHSRAQQSSYDGVVPLAKGEGGMVGEMTDATDFPDGSAFLTTGTYLGTLPGAPVIAKTDYDLMDQTAHVKLIGVPDA